MPAITITITITHSAALLVLSTPIFNHILDLSALRGKNLDGTPAPRW